MKNIFYHELKWVFKGNKARKFEKSDNFSSDIYNNLFNHEAMFTFTGIFVRVRSSTLIILRL